LCGFVPFFFLSFENLQCVYRERERERERERWALDVGYEMSNRKRANRCRVKEDKGAFPVELRQ
jgi:hypothetical protein